MSEPRQERADAARNRAAILHAAEQLLAGQRPEHISLDQIAQHAGVGKGTIFHRFGSRTGLMRSLMQERVRVLDDAIQVGPPPLGPGAPPQERLIAFLDAAIDLATRNIALIAAYEQAEQAEQGERQEGFVYQSWHRHIASLITEARPDLDADLIGHILLSSLHSDLVTHLLRRGETTRLTTTLRELVASLLDAPQGDPSR